MSLRVRLATADLRECSLLDVDELSTRARRRFKFSSEPTLRTFGELETFLRAEGWKGLATPNFGAKSIADTRRVLDRYFVYDDLEFANSDIIDWALSHRTEVIALIEGRAFLAVKYAPEV